jgi:hypothetical protein
MEQFNIENLPVIVLHINVQSGMFYMKYAILSWLCNRTLMYVKTNQSCWSDLNFTKGIRINFKKKPT